METNHLFDDGGPQREFLQVAIRCTSGEEIRVTASSETTIEDFKSQLAETELSVLRDPQLQLIFGGRILSDGWMPLSSYGIVDGCCLLAISARTSTNTPAPQQPQGSYGFDRLVESGFSQEEVAAFRSQFFASSPSAQLLLGNLAANGTDDRAQQLRDLEEAWMNAQNEGQGLDSANGQDIELGPSLSSPTSVPGHVPHSQILFGPDGNPVPPISNVLRMMSAAVTGYGSNADMLTGIFIGFLVPWLPVLMFAMENIVTNRSFKLGLVTGVACNIALGMIRHISFNG